MTVAVSRALLLVAGRCLGTHRQDWAVAMDAEFDAAIDDGKPFAFAIGCLIAACREMIRQSEGRLVLANYTLTLGLILPMAALQFGQVISLQTPFKRLLPGALIGAHGNPYLILSLNNVLPIFALVWLMLGAAHLRLAWVLLEGDWSRIVRSAALITAATTTIFLFSGIMMIDLSLLFPQVAGLGVELTAILMSAWWHSRLSTRMSMEPAVR